MMDRNATNEDETSRKRNQNRIAQQKYRMRMKLRMEALEKQAAVAVQTTKCLGTTEINANTLLPRAIHSLPRPEGQSEASWPAMAPGRLHPQGITGSAPSITTEPTPANKHHAKMPCSNPSPGNAGFMAAQNVCTSTRYDGESELFDTLTYNPPSPPPFADFSVSDYMPLNDEQHLPVPGHSIDSYGIFESLDLGERGKKQPERQIAGQPPTPPKTVTDEPMASNTAGSSQEDGSPQSWTAERQRSLEGRVFSIMKCIQDEGFNDIEAFIICYYMDKVEKKSGVKAMQEAGRTQGLPKILEGLRDRSKSWPFREAYPYRDGIVRSAADLVESELDRLSRKMFDCETQIQQCVTLAPQTNDHTEGFTPPVQLYVAASQLKETLRDELPSLTAFLESISGQSANSRSSVDLPLLLSTLRVMASDKDEPWQEAAEWVRNRAKSR